MRSPLYAGRCGKNRGHTAAAAYVSSFAEARHTSFDWSRVAHGSIPTAMEFTTRSRSKPATCAARACSTPPGVYAAHLTDPSRVWPVAMAQR
jgi:hypothetical protein